MMKKQWKEQINVYINHRTKEIPNIKKMNEPDNTTNKESLLEEEINNKNLTSTDSEWEIDESKTSTQGESDGLGLVQIAPNGHGSVQFW
jgi:hypothetical protein